MAIFYGNKQQAPPPSAAVDGSIPAKSDLNRKIATSAIILAMMVSFIMFILIARKAIRHYRNTSTNHAPPKMNPKKVVKSLPMYGFSGPRDPKDGMECAVCMTKFEPHDFVKILPKCKHAFHVDCMDAWLNKHSTCPLCRCRIEPKDVLFSVRWDKSQYSHNQNTSRNNNLKISGNARISGRHSYAGESGNSLKIVVENPGHDSRVRFSLDFKRSKSSLTFSCSTSCNKHKCGDEAGKSGQLDENQGRMSNSCYTHRCVNEARPLAENPGRSLEVPGKDGQQPVPEDKDRLEHRITIPGTGEGTEEEVQREKSNATSSTNVVV